MSERNRDHEVVIPASSESSAHTIVDRLGELGLKTERMQVRKVTEGSK